MDVVVRNLIPLRGNRQKIADELVAGLVEKSYAVIVDHGVGNDLYERATRAAQAFFRKPLGHKLEVDIRRSFAHRGYVPQTEIGDYEDEGGIRRYEAFDIGRDLDASDPMVAAKTPLLGPNFWPAHPDDPDAGLEFKAAANALFEALAAKSAEILQLLEIGFDLRPGTFSQYRQQPLSQLRFINYFERPQDAGEHVAMGAHTDYEFITLIREFKDGLQVRSPRGGWENVHAPPGSLVLLAGDLLETVTGGQVQSCLHRIPNIEGPRFSIPFFAGADYSAVVSPAMGNRENQPAVAAGPHLLRQLLRDFPYLRDRFTLPNVIDLRDAAVDEGWNSAFERRHGVV